MASIAARAGPPRIALPKETFFDLSPRSNLGIVGLVAKNIKLIK